MLSLIVVIVALLAVGTASIWLPLLSMLADRLADGTWRDKQTVGARGNAAPAHQLIPVDDRLVH